MAMAAKVGGRPPRVVMAPAFRVDAVPQSDTGLAPAQERPGPPRDTSMAGPMARERAPITASATEAAV